jgi:thymidylate kinase
MAPVTSLQYATGVRRIACTRLAETPDAVTCLAALDRAGLPYCLVRHYELDRAAPGSDIDFVVPEARLPYDVATTLRAAADDAGRLLIQAVDHDGAWSFAVCPRAPRSADDFTRLDAWPAPDVGPYRFYSGADLLARRQRNDVAWVPETATEFGVVLTRRLVKRDLRPQHLRALAALYAKDPAGCVAEVARLWGPRTAKELAWLMRANAWNDIAARAPSLRFELVRRAARTTPLAIVGRVLRRMLVRARHLVRPRNGVDVVFLGPDGAGKSTVMDELRAAIEGGFSGVEFHGGAPSLRQLRDGTFRTRTLLPTPGVLARPHGLPARARAASVLKAGYWFVYYVLGYHATVRPALARGRLVLHHRHLVDALVDPRRYRYGGPRWLLALLWWLTPKPDLVILLDAPADVIRARKGELPRAEIERQLEAFRALVGAMPNGHVVDAGQPPARTVADTAAIIIDFMAARTARRLAGRS